MKNNGAEFINRLYKDMYSDDSVLIIDRKSKPVERIKKYLDLQQKLHEGIRKSNHVELLKRFYYQKYVVKEEDITDNYFELQKKLALERGYGHIKYSEYMKRQERKNIIIEQQKSLDRWLDYFLSDDSKFYPMWAKYWAFQGMLNIGRYDKEKQKFTKRTKKTVSSFIELNRESLAIAIDYMKQFVEEEKLSDDDLLNILIKNGSFVKLYEHIINKLKYEKTESSSSDEGIWVKYDRGSNPRNLVKSLQGMGTGWCTAGEGTASLQLSMGDFYVYYSKNNEGEYTMPRVAIRTEQNKIAEVRGIAPNQNLEPEMEEIVDKKLDEFPDKAVYKKKVSDMRMLTTIYKKHQEGLCLDKSEIKFLYEINSPITGFGYERDPRIDELIKNRNSKKDLAYTFNLSEDEIGVKKEDIYKHAVNVYCNTLSFKGPKIPKNVRMPKMIIGTLDLSELETAKGLILPQIITINLYLSNLETAKALVLPQRIGGSLFLGRLENVYGVTLPREIGKNLHLSSLLTVDELILPLKIGGDLWLNKLRKASKLIFPKVIGKSLYLDNLIDAQNLVLPEEIGEHFYLNGLTSTKNITLPKKIGGYLMLRNLESLDELSLPEEFECQMIITPFGAIYPNNFYKYQNGHNKKR